VGITQSGRIVYLRAVGLAKRSSGTKLSTTDRSGIGSVSKLFTTFTVIKLIEDGELGLHDRLLDHFFALGNGPSATDFPFLPEGESVPATGRDARISELLNHTGRWESKSTSQALWAGRKSDKCNRLRDEDWLPDPRYRCNRAYQNADTGLLGWMLFHQFGLAAAELTQNAAYVQALKEYWMNDAEVGGVFCGGYDDVLHYRLCSGGGAACIDGYKEFEREAPGVCFSGSLAASTEDLLQLLNVFRYGKAMGGTAHSMLYQTEARDKDGGVAPFHWGQTLLDGEGWMRGKSGGGDGVTAYVAHFPRGVSVAIISNTEPQKETEETAKSPSSGAAVKAAWTAATGISIGNAQDDED
jgi:CubicO group peptidase (beta-lactamase class C family)